MSGTNGALRFVSAEGAVSRSAWKEGQDVGAEAPGPKHGEKRAVDVPDKERRADDDADLQGELRLL